MQNIEDFNYFLKKFKTKYRR